MLLKTEFGFSHTRVRFNGKSEYATVVVVRAPRTSIRYLKQKTYVTRKKVYFSHESPNGRVLVSITDAKREESKIKWTMMEEERSCNAKTKYSDQI